MLARARGCAQVRRGRILVCAQSNAAIDELVVRLTHKGFFDEYGCPHYP